MQVKTNDHEVKNVREAITLAREWQSEGTHEWFRGHNKSDWPLTSCLVRVQLYRPETEDSVQARIGHFCAWLETVPELRYLLEPENTHAFFAVLQHHGLPTHYVDFTTRPEIAGFFAACGPDVKAGEMGCIIAIDVDEAVAVGRIIAEGRQISSEGWPERVTVSVENLSRMQAQSGHFLYLPFPGIEAGYCYDRILFTQSPHGGEPPYDIPEDLIYPKRKSPLEVRLDQFFTAELMANNQIYLQNLYESWRGAGMLVTDIRFDGSDPKQYLVPGHGTDRSWSDIAGEWSLPAPQQFQKVFTTESVELLLDLGVAPSQIAVQIERHVSRLLIDNPQYRQKALNWTLSVTGQQAPHWVKATAQRLARVWDGMRPFPFSDGHLGAALGVTLALSVCVLLSGGEITCAQTFVPLFGPTIVIDVVAEDGTTYAKAAAGDRALRSAFRDDLTLGLAEPWRAQCGSEPRKVLQVLNDPRLLFSFPKLIDLFARQIIPTQVLFNDEGGAVFFSPAQTGRIGLH